MADDEVVAYCTVLRPRLVGFLTLHCGDRGVAEELAQETLIRVWDRWATVRRASSPDAWAHRVALNLANSHFRRRAAERRARHRMGETREAEEETDTSVAVSVRDAVAALPPRQRAAVVLRFYGDLSVADAAAVLNCAPGTVKSLTARGVAALRQSLVFEDEEASDAIKPA